MVGFDDIPAAINANLTTIAQDYGRAGEVLGDTLIAQIAGCNANTATPPTRLVERGSS